MNDTQARNIVVMLQADPLSYRNYGCYWWHVKKELKAHGYDQNNLAHLGDFTDRHASAYYEGMSPAELTAAALETQAGQAFTNAKTNWHYTPDGDVYFLLDEDAE